MQSDDLILVSVDDHVVEPAGMFENPLIRAGLDEVLGHVASDYTVVLRAHVLDVGHVILFMLRKRSATRVLPSATT